MCAAKTPARKRARAKATRGKQLVIVESPAKAETIGRFLGPDYVVDASYGHVRDLPARAEERPAAIRGEAWAELGVNVERDFEPVYIVPKEKAEHVRRLKRELKTADKLLLATDEDREGESIGWHLCELLEPAVPVERIVFHEVTQEAIAEALRSPRDVDQNLVEAQEARRILDRLFGYSLSPVLWRRIRAGTSAGRVQSVAVRFTVQRERERAAFRRARSTGTPRRTLAGKRAATAARDADNAWVRTASPTSRDFDPIDRRARSGKNVRLLDEDADRRRWSRRWSRPTPWTVTKRRRSHPVPTGDRRRRSRRRRCSRQANRRLGYSARRTMQIAQGLYEGVDLGAEREGLITYMRTDSVTLSSQALAEAQTVIAREYGDGFAQGPRGYKTRSRNAQEAHEAIRPTHLRRTPASLRSAPSTAISSASTS